MGASTVYLAQRLNCRATGITLSPVQARWARWAARWRGVADRVEFVCQDVEHATYPRSSFDVVWSIECTEHLFDKPAFFRNAADWLRPGGRVAICAWLAGEELQNEEARQQVVDVCEGFFCPSLGTQADYVHWLDGAGLEVTTNHDWTESVMRTWEICRDRVRRMRMRSLARLIDADTVTFLDSFETILSAYRSGAMRYGCFIARKP
jgi:tocopherol O-methyltransferase